MYTKNKDIKFAIFFNSTRGLVVFTKVSKKFPTDIYLALKNLNPEILKYLKDKKIKYTLIKKINLQLIKKITNKNYELLISAGFPLIFPEDLINSSRLGTINLHAGKLPAYKGGSPLNWQIINGEKNIGISIMRMNKKLDDGDIYSSKIFKLKKNDTIKTVHDKVNSYFPKMTMKVIDNIYSGIKPIAQKKTGARTYRQRSEVDGLIDWKKKDANQVFNFIRALTKPYPGAYYFDANGQKNKIYKCSISKHTANVSPGTKFFVKKKEFIKCKKYSIQVKS